MPGGKLDRIFREQIGETKLYVPYYRNSNGVTKTYSILFTPRSGSTWLTGEIAAYDVLSCPGEYFNVECFAESLKSNPCCSIAEYYDVVSSRMKTNEGMFGFEISFFDLEELEREISLLALMQGETFFIYLNRTNFVLQGISLYMAVETGVFHQSEEALSRHTENTQLLSYDSDRLRYWICHILQQEFGLLSWLRDRKLHFLSITYEELCADIQGTIDKISAHVKFLNGLPKKKNTMPQVIKLLGKDLSLDFEEKFRNEHADWVHYWELNRGLTPCLFQDQIEGMPYV